MLTRLNYSWKRGHLVNGDWGGPGQLVNMTPLTPADNTNHKTVKQYMRAFCQASLNYEGGRTGHIGTALLTSFNVPSIPGQLCQLTRTYIHTRPRSSRCHGVQCRFRNLIYPRPGYGLQSNVAGFPTVAAFPLGFNVPARPLAIGGACVPLANLAGGKVYNYPGFNGTAYPAIQANRFDGGIEVHQS
jgi:hypothetical protein